LCASSMVIINFFGSSCVFMPRPTHASYSFT
jgi:hypothetical protein